MYNNFGRLGEQTSIMLLLKQEPNHEDYIKKVTRMTDAQIKMLMELGGNPMDKSQGNSRKGELCMIMKGHAAFSIFTGMNNLDVITTTSDKYTTALGFTQEEVFTALDDAGLGEQKEKVKKWYDGFIFGISTDIYNPWSIVSFINKKGKYGTY